MTRIVFVDTETTGIAPDDDIWEFAAIVRRSNGGAATYRMFIEHDPDKCAKLPENFLSDHRRRFPTDCTARQPHPNVVSRIDAAEMITALFPSAVPMRDRPHIVGSNPSFDTERTERLLRCFGYEPGWYYHPHDVMDLAVGWLMGVAARTIDEARMHGEEPPPLDRSKLLPPWDSEAISRAVGVDPDAFDRHQALGDVKWAMAIWDAVAGERP